MTSVPNLRYPMTDRAVADMILDRAAGEIMNVKGQPGQWVWNGIIWVEAKQEPWLEKYFRALVDQIKENLRSIERAARNSPRPVRLLDQEGNPVRLREVKKMIQYLEKGPALRNISKWLMSGDCPNVEFTDLDADDNLLNARNVIIDLKTGKALDRNSSYLMTKVCNVNYDQNFVSKAWIRFIDMLTGSDKEYASYMQRLLGYCITGLHFIHIFPILFGPGQDGKSTLANNILRVIGNYGKPGSKSVLLSRGKNWIPSDRSALLEARLAFCPEFDRDDELDEGTIKAITGDERMSTRKLYENEKEVVVKTKTIITANSLPRIKCTQKAMWRRIRVCPCYADFSDMVKANELITQIQQELPGVLTWLVKGAKQVIAENDIGTCSVVQKASESFRKTNNQAERFMEEKIRKVEAAKTSLKMMHATYERWAKENGEKVLGKQQLGEELEKLGLAKSKSGIWSWEGVVV